MNTPLPLLRIGLIGCGGRGKNAWKAHCPEKGFVLSAGADVNPEFLRAFAGAFPECRIFSEWRAMLREMPELDAVMISSPLEFHEEMTLAALEAGKHVFLEKPMAHSVEACDRMIRKSLETGKMIFTGHNLRNYSFLSLLKEVVDSGEIGEVRSIWLRHFIGYAGRDDRYWKFYEQVRFRFGMLLHKGCHDLDAIRYLGGAPAVRVSGIGSSTGFGGEVREDHNMILLELENGVQAACLQCAYTPDENRNFSITGTLGRIENTGSNYGQTSVRILTTRGGKGGEKILSTPPPVKNESEDADRRCVDQFLESLRTGVPAVPMLDARNAVAAALAGQRSIREKTFFSLNPHPDFLSNSQA